MLFRSDVSGILYEGQSLRHLPATEAFKYLGIRISLTGSYREEREHVLAAVNDLRTLVKGHKYEFDQMVDSMQMVASSRFRYSATLTPWSDAQLDRLHTRWIGLAKTAWRLPPAFPGAPLLFPTLQGGSPVPHPRVYLVQALATHIEQLVALPDQLRERTIHEYRRLCDDTGCHTSSELIDFLTAERRPRQCPIARLLRACGQLGISVRLPACLSLGPREQETSWHHLYMKVRDLATADTASDAARDDFVLVQRHWNALRLALSRNGYRQPRMLIDGARSNQPKWRPLAFTQPWRQPLYRLLQQFSFAARRQLFPALDRGRRSVVTETHRDLISDTIKALRTPSEQASLFRDEGVVACFRDPRWAQVRCRVLDAAWIRLLNKYSLSRALTRFSRELADDPAIANLSGVTQIGRAHV